MPDELLDALESRSKTEPFAGFRCWDADEVAAIMHREAAAPSRAVLLATHQPPHVRRVAVTDAGRYGEEQLVTEEDLLALVREPGDGALIVPIVGASGSGKSHLVLWLRARFDEQPSAHRKVIYLRKGDTSLARVIELILDGRGGGRFDELRTAVQRASRAMDVPEAARRLRDELALAAGRIDPAAAGPALAPYREHVRLHLVDLLDDPAYSTRLVGEGGALRRIVSQALEGGREEVAQLEPADLVAQLTTNELEALSLPAKDFLAQLQDPQLHAVALGVLNEVRDRCLSRVFGVEPLQLVRVMRDLREQLHVEDPQLELVLMVEDFTLLQGIQHDLLEAMIELPRREGRQVMCAMKTVMAVTRGFFDTMLAASDTLRTRIAAQGYVYDLDVPYEGAATGAVDRAAAADFAARYLNAVRVGAETLDARSPAVPNACDRCAHRDRCHDAFGTAGEARMGLYPFNEQAIDRMVRSRQERFGPRDVLRALSETLAGHGDELAAGRFPSRAWARAFEPRDYGRPPLPTLPLTIEEQVKASAKPEQREIMLTFWGGAPQTLRNLPDGIHEAFGVPRLEDAPVVVPAPAAPAPSAPTPTPQQQATPETDDAELTMRQWRDGTRLDAESARTLRRAFRDAILAALDPGSRLLSPQLVDEWFGSPRDTDVRIANAAGSGRPPEHHFRVELDVGDALLLAGVLRAQRQRNWRFPDGPRLLVAFLDRVDAEAQRLARFLDERLAERRADHAAAIALLALSGLAAGHGGANDSRALLSAALSLDDAPVADASPDRWSSLVQQCARRREQARAFALQGAYLARRGGALSAVDGSRLLPALSALRTDWQLPAVSEAAPQAVVMLRQVLDARLDDALADARERLAEWHADVAALIGDPATLSTRAKAWQAALEEAQAAGFLVGAAGPRLDGRNWAQAGALLRDVARLLERWEEAGLGGRVADVAGLPWARLVRLREELQALATALRGSAEKARTQRGDDGAEAPSDAFEQAIAQLERAAGIAEPTPR